MTGTNATRDPDSVLAAWLDEGPTDLPDATRRAILTALPTTPQARRGLLAPRRLVPMTAAARIAIALVFGIAIVVGGVSLLANREGVGAPSPSPSTTPTARLQPGTSPMPVPLLDAHYVSPLYSYFIEYPGSWSASSATKRWATRVNSAADKPWWGDAALDELRGSDVRLVVWEQAIPSGETADQWIANLAVGEGVCQASSALPESFVVGQSQGHVILNGCRANGGLLKDGVVYEVAVTYRGAGWDFTFDGRIDADYVLQMLRTVALLPPTDVAPRPS